MQWKNNLKTCSESCFWEALKQIEKEGYDIDKCNSNESKFNAAEKTFVTYMREKGITKSNTKKRKRNTDPASASNTDPGNSNVAV